MKRTWREHGKANPNSNMALIASPHRCVAPITTNLALLSIQDYPLGIYLYANAQLDLPHSLTHIWSLTLIIWITVCSPKMAINNNCFFFSFSFWTQLLFTASHVLSITNTGFFHLRNIGCFCSFHSFQETLVHVLLISHLHISFSLPVKTFRKIQSDK